MTGETYLTAAEVTKSYGDVTAVSEVSLDIPSNAVTGFIGPNGSGKTTLLRMLLGVERPTSGTISYSGPDAERQLGYLPQRPTFRPGFSVRETAGFYADLVDDDPDRLLERVGLEEVASRPVSGLSGGMTRLLGIAQALAGDPPIVMLDEPASGLDPAMSRLIFDIVESIADAGRAVVLCSHELPLVEQTADRLVVLESGRLVRTGSVASLREQTGGPLHETFTALLEQDRATVAAPGGEEP
ncbi:ABC transporter ATP-binding protein [Haloarcula rubripromontorii]|uniref:ABC transporter ATP-binding protein n=1 Tax=Haloarcula rubripromontorii TaxID=1705562 RepID=A0A0M9AG11_9EURY|nr:ABC transporter ATP-binding protein [Haloarcula rubripromontorii]KOX91317.1 ABC transporter ATP-binding protein [Haloarcula rubripromontorii]